MGTAKPVHAETITTPLKGQLDDDALAFIAVKVQKASAGCPRRAGCRHRPRRLFTQSTDASGCATFQVNVAGNYTLTLNTPGWVDQTGVKGGMTPATPSTKTPVTVAAGRLTQAMMTYDRAAAMDVTVLPRPVATCYRARCPWSTSRNRTLPWPLRAGPSPARVPRHGCQGLWPQPAGYSLWAGGCGDSDPAGPPTSGSRVAPVVVAPAEWVPSRYPLAAVDLTARSSATATIPNGVVTATSAVSTGCTTPDRTLTLGTTKRNRTAQGLTSVRRLEAEHHLLVDHQGGDEHDQPPAARDGSHHVHVEDLLMKTTGMAALRRVVGDPSRREAGLTLTEMLTTMMLTGLLLGMCATLFIGSTRSVHGTQNRLEEISDGRIAISSMGRAIRTAILPSQLFDSSSVEQSAFISATPTSLRFYANLDNPGNTVGPSKVSYDVSPGSSRRRCSGPTPSTPTTRSTSTARRARPARRSEGAGPRRAYVLGDLHATTTSSAPSSPAPLLPTISSRASTPST